MAALLFWRCPANVRAVAFVMHVKLGGLAGNSGLFEV